MKLDIRRVAGLTFAIPLLAGAWGSALATDTAGFGKHSRNTELFQAAEYLKNVSYLASDELEGRGTGQPGIDKAAEYIAAEFERLGLKGAGTDGTFFHNFTLQIKSEIGPETRLAIGKNDRRTRRRVTVGEDFVPFPFSGRGEFEGEVVFAGYGIVDDVIEYDDYDGVDVADKVVLVLRRTPKFDDFGMGNATFQTKASRASGRDAAAILVVNPEGDADGDRLYNFESAGRGPSYGIPMLHITRETADAMLKSAGQPPIAELQKEIESRKRPCSRVLKGVTVRGNVEIRRVDTPVRNVIGMIPGEGPNADEMIVVGAHYDHLGIRNKGLPEFNPKKDISNGADDNASGTAAVMMLAKAFSQGARPNRSIVLMLFTGEEMGLLGSRDFARNPTIDLKKVVAMINLDMVGRLKNDKLEVGGMRTGDGFEDMVKRLSKPYGFKISDGGGGRGPSDHTSFYEKNIPVLFFFTGLHKEYHQPEDDVHLVNIEGGVRITQLVADCIDEIDARTERVAFNRDTSRARIFDQRRDRDEEPRAIARGPDAPRAATGERRAADGSAEASNRTRPDRRAEGRAAAESDRDASSTPRARNMQRRADAEDDADRSAARGDRPAARQDRPADDARRAGPPDEADQEPGVILLAGPNRVRLGIMANAGVDGGVEVLEVATDSPAEKAGIQAGDVIIKIGQTAVDNTEELMTAVGKFKPGDKTKVTFERDGKEMTVDVSFPEAPSAGATPAARPRADAQRPEAREARPQDRPGREPPAPAPAPGRVRLGIMVDPEVEDGVGVADVSPDTPAARAKIQPGDVIIKLGNREIETFEELVAALGEQKPGGKTKITVDRDGKELTLDVTFAAEPATPAPAARAEPGRRAAPAEPARRPARPADRAPDAAPRGRSERGAAASNARTIKHAKDLMDMAATIAGDAESSYWYYEGDNEAVATVVIGGAEPPARPKGRAARSAEAVIRELGGFLSDLEGRPTCQTSMNIDAQSIPPRGWITITIKTAADAPAERSRPARSGQDRARDRESTPAAARPPRAARPDAAPESRRPSPARRSDAGDRGGDGEAQPAMPKVRLGIMPSYGEGGGEEGYEISGVIEGGPAAKAGMKDDDRILTIGGKAIKDVYGYMESLSKYKPGDTIEVVVLRAGKQVTLKIKADGPKPRDGDS